MDNTVRQAVRHLGCFGMKYAVERDITENREVIMKPAVMLLLMLGVCLSLTALPQGTAAALKTDPVPRDEPLCPYNLQAALININDVLLIWENPVYLNLPMGFRIYCNNVMVRYVPGANTTDCLLTNVCAGCHQFYVTAFYDTGCESVPSNIAEITVTALSENVYPVRSPGLVIYPCPARYDVHFSVQSEGKAKQADISIYNAKGQFIRRFSLSNGEKGLWDRKDSAGRAVSEGIYYMRAVTPEGSVTRKFTLLK